VDLGTVAMVALIGGFAGGAVGAVLVGTVEAILRRRIERSVPKHVRTFRSTYTRKDPE